MIPKRIRLVLAGALALLAWPALAIFGRADFVAGDENFSNTAVVRGVRATAEQCAAAADAVWATTATGEGECLRYWSAGWKPGANPRVLVYFQGDLLAGTTVLQADYERQKPSTMKRFADDRAAQLGVPYIYFARPGTFGSSGEHRQRRRAAEAQLVSAALDAIKKAHGVQEFAVAGHSGGGHIVAALLNYRSDIICAVPAAGVVQPAERARLKGWSIDSTGYADSYEPAQHLDPQRWHPKLRIFVVGDPLDSNTPWPTQKQYAEQVRQRGGRVELIEAEGVGAERHGLGTSARKVAAWCMEGQETPEILEKARKGLKG